MPPLNCCLKERAIIDLSNASTIIEHAAVGIVFGSISQEEILLAMKTVRDVFDEWIASNCNPNIHRITEIVTAARDKSEAMTDAPN